MRKITTLIAAILLVVGLNAQKVTLTFKVNMQPAIDADLAWFKQASATVWITGDFNGWDKPSEGESLKLAQVSGTVIYTGSIEVDANTTVLFKTFGIGDDVATWDNGEWTGDPNREAVLATSDLTVEYNWAEKPVVESVDESALASVSMYPNPVSGELFINGLENVSRITVTNVLGQVVKNITNVANVTSVDMSQLEKGIYLVSVVDANNNVKTVRIVKQ